MKAKNTVKTLNARQKKSMMLIAKDNADKDAKTVIRLLCKRLQSMGLVEDTGEYNAMLAVSLAFYTMAKAERNGVKPVDMVKQYAAFKQATSEQLNDLGAFGDLWEVLLRIFCKPASLVRFNDLHVQVGSTTDINIRGKRCEIGTNGKTLADSTKEEPLHGPYDYMVYAVIDEDEKAAFFRLAKSGRVMEAARQAARCSYVFDKQTFFDLMATECGRKPAIQYKETAGHWQVVYNPSKHSAFLKMVEKYKIPTLAEWTGRA